MSQHETALTNHVGANNFLFFYLRWLIVDNKGKNCLLRSYRVNFNYFMLTLSTGWLVLTGYRPQQHGQSSVAKYLLTEQSRKFSVWSLCGLFLDFVTFWWQEPVQLVERKIVRIGCVLFGWACQGNKALKNEFVLNIICLCVQFIYTS